jgi:RNA polymerase sigma-70 factor (ECF subfamily)
MSDQTQTQKKQSVDVLGDPKFFRAAQWRCFTILRAGDCAQRFDIDISEEATDLAIEVLEHASGAFEDFRNESALETWIYRIATNMTLNRIDRLERRWRRAPTYPLGSWSRLRDAEEDDGLGPLDPPDSRFDPSVVLQEKSKHLAVMEALGTLRPDYREVILLCAYHKLSYREIAEILGTTDLSVKSKLNRARIQLKEAMRRRPTTRSLTSIEPEVTPSRPLDPAEARAVARAQIPKAVESLELYEVYGSYRKVANILAVTPAGARDGVKRALKRIASLMQDP